MRRVTQESHVGYVFRKLDDAQAFRTDVLASGLCEAEPGTSIEVDELEPATVLGIASRSSPGRAIA